MAVLCRRMKNTAINNNKIAAFPAELITKKDLAKRLKVCVRMVELQTNQGIIPIIRIGSAVRYCWSDVLTALKEHQERQVAEAVNPIVA